MTRSRISAGPYWANERGVLAGAFGLVQADRRFGEGVVVCVTDGPDGGFETFQDQRLGEVNESTETGRRLQHRLLVSVIVAGALGYLARDVKRLFDRNKRTAGDPPLIPRIQSVSVRYMSKVRVAI